MKVAIYELPAVGGGFVYRAFAGALRSDGRTAGEALDRVASQFPEQEVSPLVIVQHRHGDRFFPPRRFSDWNSSWSFGVRLVRVVRPYRQPKGRNWNN